MQLFLTDYASYNAGTQFEFGHWVDLTQFDDAQEFFEYIGEHFEEADKKSPLDEYGSKREEIMFTDYEGFPKSLYAESMGEEAVQKIFDFHELGTNDWDDEDWLNKHNEYCSETNRMDDYIYYNDEEFFQTYFANKPWEAARAAKFGDWNPSDDYVEFNGYGNLRSINEHAIGNHIDKDVIIEWMLENL